MIRVVILLIVLFVLFFGSYETIRAVRPWFLAWQQRRADRKIIKASLKFMGRWGAYQAKKPVEPLDHPFAAKVEQLKRLAAKTRKDVDG